MTISINWGTKVIYVPKADMTLIQSSPEIRELNLNTFRLTLKDLEDDEAGMPFPKTHNHSPPVSVGGVLLARVVEILEPYTVTFENEQYAVNLVGANTNVQDKTAVNQVSIRPSNSAGLIQVTSGSGLSQEEHDTLYALPDASTVANAVKIDTQSIITNNNPTIVQSVWNKPLSELVDSNAIGGYIKQKILTTGKFLGLK